MATVVLADPDDERRAGSVFALQAGQVEVVESSTLEAALTAVAKEQPHALVLAAELCKAITPQRLAAALRAQPETADIRLVLLAAIGSAVDTAGADAVLHRPTSAVDLVREATADGGAPEA